MHLNGVDMSTITGSVSSTTFNQYTSSTNEFTGSANTRITNLDNASGSFSTRVTSLESFSASLDATFATDAQLTSLSSSVTQRLASDESTITNNSSSFASRLTTDESNISSLQTASGSFSTRVTNTENNTTNNSSSFASRLTTDESNISSLQTASGSFSTRTTNNESNISGLQTASGSFSTRTTNLETASGSFSTRVTNNESNISSLQTASGSVSTRVTTIESKYATTGSNTFTGTQNITNTTNASGFTSEAALYTDGGLRVAKDAYVSGTMYINNLTVYGTQSVAYITSSQADFGTNIITVNTATPSIRFGGYAVYDSGSTGTGRTGSLLWDSQEDRWIYTTPVGSSEGYNSAIIIAGPKNTGSLGNELGLTSGKIMVAVGDDHIGDSIMNQDGSTIYVTGSLSATTLTGSLNGSNLINSSVSNAKLTNSSVTVTAGTGMSGGGSVALGSSITLTNAAPDQTVTLTNGSNITITGTYPNFTLTNGITNNNQLTNGSGYISAISSSMVTTALGYTPYNSTNPSGYISAISSSMVTTALGYTPVTNARTLTINGTTYDLSANRTWSIEAGVSSFNTRTGAITLSSGDVTGALGYTPVTNARTLTINGTAYDLSADRSWTIAAGVASVSAGTGISTSGTSNVTITNTGVTSNVAGTGISISGATGAVTITNTGLLSGTAGTGISVSTSSGNLTITNTGLLSGVAGTGISVSTSSQQLTITNTGLLSGTAGTGISVSTSSGNLTITNAGVTSNVAGTGISVSGATGAVTITNSGVTSITAGSGISISGATGGVTITNTITNNNQLTNGAGYITSAGSISGNAATATNATAAANISLTGIASVNVNNGSSAVYRTESGTGAALAYAPVLHLGGGDTMWQAQGTYGTSGNGTLYFRQGYSGSWGNWLTMLSSANYNSYSPTLTGTGASGTWSINVTGTAGSLSSMNISQFTNNSGYITGLSFDGLSSKTGGSGTYQTSGDFRAPIFYDSNDTGYFTDPAGISSMWGVAIRGDNGSTNTNNQIFFWGAGNTTTSAIGFKSNGGYFTNPTGNGDGYNTYLTMDSPGRGWVFREGVGGTDFGAAYTSGWILNNGVWQANASMRSPIFYDSNNTGYYLDPASTSNINILSVADYQYIAGQTANGQSHYQWEGATYRNPGSYNAGLIIRRDNSTTGIDGSYPTLVLYNNDGRDQSTAALSFATRESNAGGNAVPLGGIIAKKEAAGNNGGWSPGSLTFYVKDYGTRRDGMTIYTAGYVQSEYSFRSPIFYDSNNTGYYFDGASGTNLQYLNVNGTWGSNPFGAGLAQLVITGTYASMYQTATNGSLGYWLHHIASDGSYNLYGGRGATNGSDWNWSMRAFPNQDGSYVEFRTSARAPIFYDLDDTGYYLNPAGSSVLNGTVVIKGNDNQLAIDGTVGSLASGLFFRESGNNKWELYNYSGEFRFYSYTTSQQEMSLNNASGYITARTSFRAPIFYDSNDTTYWVDPNNGGFNLQGGTSNRVKFSTNDSGFLVVNAEGNGVSDVRLGAAWGRPGVYGSSYLSLGTSGTYVEFVTGNVQRGYIDDGSNMFAFGSMRSPIFYDYNNTGYYLDPASTSNLNTIRFGTSTNNTTLSGNGDWGVRFNNDSGWVQIGPANGGWAHIYSNLNFYMNTHLWISGGYKVVAWDYNNGGGALYASTFYDADNTGYYLNPSGASYLYSLQLAGGAYFRPNTWIQMDGSYGLYWPNNNGAHIYAHTGSYGSIRIDGSRNSWRGISFDASVTLMMNDNESGHYKDGYGWQYRWYNGSMYISTSAYGGGSEYTIVHTGNIASYTAGNVNNISSAVGGGYTWTGINYFNTNNGGYAGSTNSAKLQAYSDSNNSAFMSFHKGGHYAVNMGLDADNVMRIGGWSAAANRWQLDMSGNMTVAGDVTAYSDARVKTNVNTIENALEKTLALRGVTYNRTDSEDVRTKVGVIAQEIIEVLPEVVNQDNDGMYNVSYGNITALLIEAIKEQQSQIEVLKAEIEELKLRK
jgi:hypothetical protein